MVVLAECFFRRYFLLSGCIIGMILNSAMVILTRIHYTIDVTDGIFVAIFCVNLGEYFSVYLDRWINKKLVIKEKKA